MRMFHGTSSDALPLHEGLCLTPDDDRAWDYARQAFGDIRYVHEIDFDIDGLVIVEVESYDHDENYTASDWASPDGADVLVYDDETAYGRAHVTYRLMTPAALAAVAMTGTESEER